MTIDLSVVGDAIAARSWRLAFSPELETRFEADVAEDRCRRIIRHNYVGLAIYNAFLLGDWFLVPDVFTVSVVLHLLVMTPIMGAVVCIMRRHPTARLRESVLAGGIVLTTVAILALMMLSRSPLRTSEHVSAVLVILFATMVQRIRFPYVIVATFASFGLYVAALATLDHYDVARMAVADAVFAGVVLFSLIGCYNLECEQRTSYLLALRDRLRNADLEAVSRRDPLTGVGNRRALDSALDRRRAAPGADGPSSAAVLLIDIDHFKAYNDNNGHLAGDTCLTRIAALIGSDVRLSSDSLFRFGGEEFLVILDDCTLAEGADVAERIRVAVERAAIRTQSGSPSVITVSVGVAAGSLSAAASMGEIVADADTALYAAKRSGRNRVRANRQGAVQGLQPVRVNEQEYAGTPTHDGRDKDAIIKLADAVVVVSRQYST